MEENKNNDKIIPTKEPTSLIEKAYNQKNKLDKIKNNLNKIRNNLILRQAIEQWKNNETNDIEENILYKDVNNTQEENMQQFNRDSFISYRGSSYSCRRTITNEKLSILFNRYIRHFQKKCCMGLLIVIMENIHKRILSNAFSKIKIKNTDIEVKVKAARTIQKCYRNYFKNSKSKYRVQKLQLIMEHRKDNDYSLMKIHFKLWYYRGVKLRQSKKLLVSLLRRYIIKQEFNDLMEFFDLNAQLEKFNILDSVYYRLIVKRFFKKLNNKIILRKFFDKFINRDDKYLNEKYFIRWARVCKLIKKKEFSYTKIDKIIRKHNKRVFFISLKLNAIRIHLISFTLLRVSAE